jgi:hypothetical protein
MTVGAMKEQDREFMKSTAPGELTVFTPRSIRPVVQERKACLKKLKIIGAGFSSFAFSF